VTDACALRTGEFDKLAGEKHFRRRMKERSRRR
jgi:hypothetical protein